MLVEIKTMLVTNYDYGINMNFFSNCIAFRCKHHLSTSDSIHVFTNLNMILKHYSVVPSETSFSYYITNLTEVQSDYFEFLLECHLAMPHSNQEIDFWVSHHQKENNILILDLCCNLLFLHLMRLGFPPR
jgi:hypothetical protein